MTSGRPVRVGVVGADPRGFGARAHIPAVIGSPRLTLAAICTAHEETARAAARQYGVSKWYVGVEALVADPDIDIVTIAVRPRFHREISQAALEADKLTYCEWPLARSVDEARAMAATAGKADVPTAVGLQGRYSAALIKLREFLLKGEIGRPLTFEVSLLQSPFRVDSDRRWLAERSEASGALHVATAHVIDAVEFVLDDIEAITGKVQTVISTGRFGDTGRRFAWNTYDTVHLLAETRSGQFGIGNISNASRPGMGFALRVVGEEGQALATADRYFQFNPIQLAFARGNGNFSPIHVDSPDGRDDHEPSTNVARALEAFVSTAGSHDPRARTFSDGYRLHTLVAAIEESSESRSWVRLIPP